MSTRKNKNQRAVEAVKQGGESAKGPRFGPNSRSNRPDLEWGYEPPRRRTVRRAEREQKRGRG